MRLRRGDKERHSHVRLEQEEQQEQMCCEDGKTAEEHRKQTPDGKCCTD